MGVDNRQRRAAKKRKAGHRPRPVGSWDPFTPEPTPELARATLIEALADIAADRSAAEPLAQQMLRADGLVPPELIRQALRSLLAELTAGAVAHGWTPSDLAHVVARQLGDARVPTVLALLAEEVHRHPAAASRRAGSMTWPLPASRSRSTCAMPPRSAQRWSWRAAWPCCRPSLC